MLGNIGIFKNYYRRNEQTAQRKGSEGDEEPTGKRKEAIDPNRPEPTRMYDDDQREKQIESCQ